MNPACRIQHRATQGVAIVLLLAATAAAYAAGAPEDQSTEPRYDIGVFVPGVVEGSPTYEMLVAGVQAAVDAASDRSGVTIVEGGYNQAGWEDGIAAMAATNRYDLIVTSNPSMPEIAARVAAANPDARFLLFDGYVDGNPAIHSVMFNQREQAFLSGVAAGLITTSTMDHANDRLIIGLLAGQEYPIMNDVIRPSFLAGARSIEPEIGIDFRVLGNWYDATRAAELAASMHSAGVDVILAIAGSANQGVLSAFKEHGGYVLWYDESGYHHEPGVVVGSTTIRLDWAAEERVRQAIDGTLEFGVGEVLGVAEGGVAFDTDAELFVEHVPEEIRTTIENVQGLLADGELYLEMPTQP